MANVELRGIRKRYGNVEVVHGIDLEVRHGEFVVFVGPSGCGKSTLLRMVAGLEGISDGELRIDGQRVNELPPRSRDIAMVFQDYALYPHKTLFENMAFGLRLRKTPEDEIQRRVMDAARLLPLLGVFLLALPLLWPAGTEAAPATSRTLTYIFGVWTVLIVAAAFLAYRLGRGEGARGRDAADG